MGRNPLYVEPEDGDAEAVVTSLPAERQVALAEAKARHAAEIDAIVNGYPSPNTSGVANTTAGSPNTSDDQADSTEAIPTGIEGINPGNEPGTSGTDGTGLDEGGVKASQLPPVAEGNGVAPVELDGTKHGELEQPNRGSSTADWRAYAAADPKGAPQGDEELSRDELAEMYLGAKTAD